MKFHDRTDAGKQLVKKLQNYHHQKNTIILALPRGGVPVAFEIATELNLPLDVFLVRKLGVPGHEETAMGAIADGGVYFLDEDFIQRIGVNEDQINQVIAKENAELKRRNKLYRKNKSLLDLQNQTIILVDDGIATGATMKAAIQALRTHKPAGIIVAAPVASDSAYAELKLIADEVVVLLVPNDFNSVSLFYQYFPQTSDQEVETLLSKAY